MVKHYRFAMGQEVGLLEFHTGKCREIFTGQGKVKVSEIRTRIKQCHIDVISPLPVNF
jgi:hypothetical protein